jgi:NADP-dependent 3-hydroxy acid dehydrogenase YdfG
MELIAEIDDGRKEFVVPMNKVGRSKKSEVRSGPVVLITGASQGIGAAIARAFARGVPGVKLALVARSSTRLGAVASSCRRLGATAGVFPCDVTDPAAVDGLASSVRRRFRHVDVLVNNAGVFAPGSLDDESPAGFDRMLSANLRSVFLVSKAFVPAMARRGRGDVFNMSSIAGRRGYPGAVGYCAAKHGVAGLTAAMRVEYRNCGVRVTCVFPGATESPTWKGSSIPAKRMMAAEDVAEAFLGAWRLSRRTVVEEIVLRPQFGDL